jgi:hypothetical protein
VSETEAGLLFQFLSTRIVTGPEFPDAQFITLPPPEFYSQATRAALSAPEDRWWWQSHPAGFENEGLVVIRGGGGMFEKEPRLVVSGLADVLAERGPLPSEATLLGGAVPPQILIPVAEAIFLTVSIPISQSPMRGSTLADLMALAGGIDFQTVHLTHLGGREIVLALLTAAGCKIAFGIADAITYALRNGLSYYLLRWMGVPETFAIEHARKQLRRFRARWVPPG